METGPACPNTRLVVGTCGAGRDLWEDMQLNEKSIGREKSQRTF